MKIKSIYIIKIGKIILVLFFIIIIYNNLFYLIFKYIQLNIYN